MRRYLVLALALGAIAVGAAFVSAQRADARLAACGAGGPNTVDVTFDIPAANRIWDFVPGLQETPELENDSAPAFVVLFSGNFTSPFGGTFQGGGERAPRTYQNVMCVVQADGTVNLYADIPREGMTLP